MAPLGGKSVDELDGSEPAEEAVALLFDAHAARIRSLGLRFCGDPEQANDLVQETFLQAFRHWGRFEGRSKPSTWLYTIASRVCQRFHRRRVGEPDKLESLDELLPFGAGAMGVVPEEEGPLAQGIREEGKAAVEAAIAGLPEPFRMPLVLKEIAGFPVADVAAILGLQEATVKTRLHRARLKVRKALEERLPKTTVPPPAYDRQVCLDLLAAKQESLDRGVAYRFPDAVVCRRCSELFATLDLTGELCRELARGDLPAGLRERVLAGAAGG